MGVGQRELLLMAATIEACESWMVANPTPGAVPDPTRPKEIKAPPRATGAQKMGRCERLIRARKYYDKGWPLDCAILMPAPPSVFLGRDYRSYYKRQMKALKDARTMPDGVRLEYIYRNGYVSMEDIWLMEILPVDNAKDAASLRNYVGAHGMARQELIARSIARFGT